jgi:hypothetical protein
MLKKWHITPYFFSIKYKKRNLSEKHHHSTMACEGCRREINELSDSLQEEVFCVCEKYNDWSDFYQDYIHDMLETVVQNYYTLVNNSEHTSLHCSLVNAFSRNYSYITKKQATIEKLCDCFRMLNNTLYNKHEYVCKLKNLFGCVMHGVFPNHYRAYAYLESRLENCTDELLQHIIEKFV